ncbi:MAG: type II secretion system GspH family protein, partial [Fusobacterium sp.]|nr:type II secretion system GspH family protein [Fusobacterium sp.]
STGFTMAEILLSLTIIGVVAAITLPSLTGNINERTWSTQRKALYARFSQALPLMDALNGYGTLNDTTDNAAETFVTGGLSKVLKINNICDDSHLKDCGVPEKINTLKGNNIPTPVTLQDLNSAMVGTKTNNTTGGETFTVKNTKAAAFETQNGESIVVYYNPTCSGTLGETASKSSDSMAGFFYIQRRICANFIYDLNGSKGPNTVGKDIGFMTAMYPFDAQLYAPYPAVSPLTFTAGTSFANYSKECTKRDGDYRSPNVGELVSMFVNRDLIDYSAYNVRTYVSTERTVNSGRTVYMGVGFDSGVQDDYVSTGNGEGSVAVSGWCVKR